VKIVRRRRRREEGYKRKSERKDRKIKRNLSNSQKSKN